MNSIRNYRLTQACLLKVNSTALIDGGINMETGVSW